MKRSLFEVFALAVMACLSAVGGWLSAVLVPKHLAHPRAGQLPAPPVVQLVAARAYLLRWLRRQVPLVQTRWRMCPSV